jgi:Thioredoxin-like domain
MALTDIYLQSGIPLALIFSSHAEERRSIAQSLSSIALERKGELHFATVDANRLGFLAEPLAVDLQRLPAFVIYTPGDESFRFDQNLQITPDAIERFIGSVLHPSQHIFVAASITGN